MSQANCYISRENYPQQEDMAILQNGIGTHAAECKNMPLFEPFTYFIRDENNKVQGGLTGSIYYGCCMIDLLWLDKSIRHQGYGNQLMEKAETLANEKECLFIGVNTMDWEALEFYKKRGYEVEFTRTGYLNHSQMYLLRKNLLRG